MKLKVLALLFLGITAMNAQTKPAARPAGLSPKVQSAPPGEGIFAQMETSKGIIMLQLEYVKAPVTVANFITLVEGNNPQVNEKYKGKKFFDGLKFHRVIKDFMIQGGDPLGNGSGDPGYKFKDEFVPELKFDKAGILAMANSGPGTNGSQFFITHKDTPWLDGKHTIFGHVLTGQDVVNAIAQGDDITKVTIIRKGAAAKKFDASKTFSDYWANKSDDEKKKEAAEAAFKKAAAEKSAVAKTKKKPELDEWRKTATTTDSGLQYKIIKKGTGAKPADGTQVLIYYAGYLEDGSLFDSNWENVMTDYGMVDPSKPNKRTFQPIPYSAGNKTGMIPGFVEALSLMSFGDKLVAFIPTKLAYGEKGAGNGLIPPNANIIFEIELQEKPAQAAAPAAGQAQTPH
jgi:cyclophilin family peptidyl-prolyl cis-trans isomerase